MTMLLVVWWTLNLTLFQQNIILRGHLANIYLHRVTLLFNNSQLIRLSNAIFWNGTIFTDLEMMQRTMQRHNILIWWSHFSRLCCQLHSFWSTHVSLSSIIASAASSPEMLLTVDILRALATVCQLSASFKILTLASFCHSHSQDHILYHSFT